MASFFLNRRDQRDLIGFRGTRLFEQKGRERTEVIWPDGVLLGGVGQHRSDSASISYTASEVVGRVGQQVVRFAGIASLSD